VNHGNGTNAIRAEDTQSIQIEGGTVKGVEEHAVFLDGVVDAYISGLEVQSPSQASVGTYDVIYTDNTTRDCTQLFVEGCYLGSKRGSDARYGINDQGCSGDNYFMGNVTRAGSGWNFTNAGSDVQGNSPTHYDLDEVLSVSSGGASLSSAIGRASLGDDIEVRAVPNNDPANDVTYEAHVFWDDSATALKVKVDESQAAGGGDARVMAKKLS
jgi:hypothetical protein